MPQAESNPPATAAAPKGAGFDAVLAKAPAKDRANMQRHLDALLALPGGKQYAASWQRLVASLAASAPHAIQAVGQDALRFFVADGRYKFQLFALEDKRDGWIQVVIPNVLEDAGRRKKLKATPIDGGYAVPDRRGDPVKAEALDANNTLEPAAHFKFMIGLNRKALRITVPAVGRPDQIELVETLVQTAATVQTANEADTAAAVQKAAQK